MKVLFLKTIASYDSTRQRVDVYQIGKEYDVPDAAARSWERTGVCRIIAKQDPAPITTDKETSPVKAKKPKAPELMAKNIENK